MASIFIDALTSYNGEAAKATQVSWNGNRLRIFVSQEFLLRSSVHATSFRSTRDSTAAAIPATPATAAENSTAERLQGEIAFRVAKLTRTSGGHPVILIPTPYPSATWWHRNLILQPDCSVPEAFSADYIALLHSTLSTSHYVDYEIDPSWILPVERVKDPICLLAQALQAASTADCTSEIIDGTDAALLVALWENHSALQRNSTGRGGFGQPPDIYITKSFYPISGISIARMRKGISKDGRLLSPAMWENFLFCLPMMIHAGLPPLAMLQYHYRQNPLQILLTAIREASWPILTFTSDGSACISIASFLPVVRELAKRESECIKSVYDSCQSRQREAQSRPLCDVEQVGWAQFRLYYYHNAAESTPPTAEMVKKRVVSYISGLLQLSSVYRGRLDEHCVLSRITMADAPLVADILSVLEQMSQITPYISLPDGTADYSDEKTSTTRKLNRMWPLFGYP